MRNARKLLLGGLTAIVAMGLGSATASAQALELREEANNLHCSAVSITGTDVNGGCLIHATSEGNIALRKHVFGIESQVGECNHEFSARADEDASAYVFEINYSGATCTRQACGEETESTPWAAGGREGISIEGTESLTVNFCIESLNDANPESCEIDLPFQGGENGNHTAEIGHITEMGGHGISGFRCELIGHWNTETGGTHDGESEVEGMITHIN